MSQKIKKIIVEEALYYDAVISEPKIDLFVKQLEGVTEEELRYAVNYLRSQPSQKFMPKPAEYLQHIPDGHPSAQESWAMMPKDEDESVIWSEEQRKAYAVAAPLIAEGNISGAFFAYKEAYEKLVSESKFSRKKPKWEPSFGMDKSGREVAVIKALEKGRLKLDEALHFYPELEYNPSYERLALTYGGQKPLLENQQNKNKILNLTRNVLENKNI